MSEDKKVKDLEYDDDSTDLSLSGYFFDANDLKVLKAVLPERRKNLALLDFGIDHQLTNEDISPLMGAIEFLKEKLPKLNTVILFNYRLSEWAVHCELKQRPNLSDITFKVSLYDINKR